MPLVRNIILELEGVSRLRHGTSPFADSVARATAKFATGRLHFIVGRRGSGKDTLLSVIAGIEPHDGGRIKVGGEELPSPARPGQPWPRRVGVVLPDSTLLGHLSAFENVLLALHTVGCAGEAAGPAAMRLLALVGLTEAALGRRPAGLSPLELRLVSVARALAGDPPVVVCSEPESRLGEQDAPALFDLLLRLAHAEDCCVVASTQSTAVARRGDEVWFMQEGILLPATL
jgi:ABC-type lipoprotein export system ATPase subunit